MLLTCIWCADLLNTADSGLEPSKVENGVMELTQCLPAELEVFTLHLCDLITMATAARGGQPALNPFREQERCHQM